MILKWFEIFVFNDYLITPMNTCVCQTAMLFNTDELLRKGI